ncbi:hypothetical protein BJ742DRAFT_857380 [Cladochytrium replicatum]|nr:hypothetical protein BJ742DRAFT_857380 [Cladochytrium replicatum]
MSFDSDPVLRSLHVQLATTIYSRTTADSPADLIENVTAAADSADSVSLAAANAGASDSIVVDVSSSAPAKKLGPAIDLASEESFPALPVSTATRSPMPPLAYNRTNQVKGGSIPVVRAVTERFEVPHHLQKPTQLHAKAISEVLRNVGNRTGTTIEKTTSNKTKSITFLVTGKAEAVKQAKREIIHGVTIEVSHTMSIPASVRPHLLGKAGSTLKALTTRTLTKISLPKPPATNGEEKEPVDGIIEEEEQTATITGDFEGVEIAKKEIEAIVAQRTSKHILRMSIPRQFHPFIAAEVELADGVKLDIPPAFLAFGPTPTEKNLDEIILRGDRAEVLAVAEKIKEKYDYLSRTSKKLMAPVKKRQQRFLLGQRGAGLDEIFKATGCSVLLPVASDTSDIVTIIGPNANIMEALQMVLDKSNSITLEELDVAALLPKGVDIAVFLRFVYIKERATLKNIEATYSVSIYQQSPTPPATSTHVLEVQGKSASDVEAAFKALKSNITTWATTLFFGQVEIPRGLHKYVVGKAGANITKVKSNPVWGGRLVDIVVPTESDESDEVMIVVKRGTDGKDAELVEKVRGEVLALANTLADFVTLVVQVDSKYHGRLIGSGGATLRELLSAYNDGVVVKFPASAGSGKKEASGTAAASADPNGVTIKGPKKDVKEVSDKILKLVEEWKHMEFVNSFSEKLVLPKGVYRRLLSGTASERNSNKDAPPGEKGSVPWLFRAVKERIAEKGESREATKLEAALVGGTLRVESDEGSEKDTLTVMGPKEIVGIARSILEERGTKLAETTSDEFALFEAGVLTSAALSAIEASEEGSEEARKKVLRRVIGKEGKGVRKVADKWSVLLRISDGRRRGGRKEEGEGDAIGEEVEAKDGIVFIRGDKKDVAGAKKELLQLVEEEILHSHTERFIIPKQALPFVVGRAGARINKIKEDSKGTVRTIDFVDVEASDGEDATEVEVLLEGKKAGVLEAKKKILDMVDENVNVGTVNVIIPSSLHKLVIGPSGSRIKKLIDSHGGRDKVNVQFPRAGAGDIVSIKGQVKTLESARAGVITILKEALKEDGVEVKGAVPVFGEDETLVEEKVVLGKGDVPRAGAVKEWMGRYGVGLWVEEDGSETVLRIAATEDSAIEAVKKELASQTKSSKTVEVPSGLLELLKGNGATHEIHLSLVNDAVRRVRGEFKVQADLDKAGQRGQAGGVVVVRGEPTAIGKAAEAISTALEGLVGSGTVTEISVPSELRPHIIGRGGGIITRIREGSGAQIEISKARAGEAVATIVIRGDDEAVARAREMVETIVKEQEERRGREAAFSARKAREGAPAVPARIDDDAGSASEVGGQGVPTPVPIAEPAGLGERTVPGLASTASGRKKVIAVESVEATREIVRTATTYGSAYWAGSDSKGESAGQWLEVGGKKGKNAGAKGDDEEEVVGAPAQVPGSAGASKKKKKNKSKGANAEEAFTPAEVVGEPTVAAVEVPKSVDAPAPAAPAESTLAEKKKKKGGANGTATVAPAANTPSPAPPQAAKAAPAAAPAPVSAPAPVADEDGWETVNTVKKYKAAKVAAAFVEETAVSSGVDGASGATKKKKNKKKKKAGATGGAGEAANGGEEDSE